MRRQGLWLKLYALFALILLLIPMSASAAVCAGRPIGMRCCMKPMLRPMVEAPKAAMSCCAGTQSDNVSESRGSKWQADDTCHCALKSLPKQIQSEIATISGSSPQGAFDYVAVYEPPFQLAFHPIQLDSIQIFFTDSGPPRSGFLFPLFGRAPPMSFG